MTLISRLLTLTLFAGTFAALGQTPASWNDEVLWKDFSEWAAALTALPPGQEEVSTERYEKRLIAMGASAGQAQDLMTRLQAYRRASPERERIYWDARFKLGGGPDQPLRLLAETVQGLKPRKALDVAMGRGRNSVYLASIGWDVTGYDLSPDALKVSQSYAAAAHVRVRTVEASHDTFDFGENQWDLIVCSYAYMTPDEPKWPDRAWKALRPGGTVVIQTSWSRGATLQELMDHWKRFRVVRYADLDAGVVADDWGPSKEEPTVELVLRKDAKGK